MLRRCLLALLFSLRAVPEKQGERSAGAVERRKKVQRQHPQERNQRKQGEKSAGAAQGTTRTLGRSEKE
jgi:hypothetical protein